MKGNTWQHVAATYDNAIRNGGALYQWRGTTNGNLGTGFTPQTPSIFIWAPGRPACFHQSFQWQCWMSQRLQPPALGLGNQGHLQRAPRAKYNTNAPTIAQGLAEAQVTLNGANSAHFLWQQHQLADRHHHLHRHHAPTRRCKSPGSSRACCWTISSWPRSRRTITTCIICPNNRSTRWTARTRMASGSSKCRTTARAPDFTNTLVSWQLRFNFTLTPPTITTLTKTQP